MTTRVEPRGHLIFSIHEEWIRNAKFLSERTDGGSGLADAYAYDRKPLGTELPMQRFLGGQLPPALRSPGGEEGEEDNLPPEVAKTHALPFGVGENEIRCFLAPLCKHDLHGGERVGCQP